MAAFSIVWSGGSNQGPLCVRGRETSWAATTVGHTCDIVRDVKLAAVGNRFGSPLYTPSEIEVVERNRLVLQGYTTD